MEARAAKLESGVSEIRNELREIRADLKALVKDAAEIKGRLAGMPTTWQLLGLIVAIMAATAGLLKFLS